MNQGMKGPGMSVGLGARDTDTLSHHLIMTPQLRKTISDEELKKRMVLPKKPGA